MKLIFLTIIVIRGENIAKFQDLYASAYNRIVYHNEFSLRHRIMMRRGRGGRDAIQEEEKGLAALRERKPAKLT